MKVLLRAPLLTSSGYGIHSRQVFNWLYNRKDVELTVECLQWGSTSWILDTERDNGTIKKIMDCSKPIEKGTYDVSFQIQLPDEWDTSLAKRNIGITAAVETDKCNPSWIDKANQMDKIIVPSTFTKNVIKRSGMLKKPIYVVPEAFNSKITNNSVIGKCLSDERFKQINTSWNLLIVGQLTSQNQNEDRKNLINTIKWSCEALKDKKDTGIVIKTNFGKATTLDKKLTIDFLKNVIPQIRKKDFPKIHLIHGNLKQEEMAALYSHPKIKAFAIATRGEGYGLPLIESAASGLPIITTNWSGHLEFLDRENFYPVDYELVNIPQSKIDNRIFMPNTKWANPSEKSFINQVNNVYKDYNSAKTKAKKMKKHIMHNFNAAAINEKYNKILNDGF